MGKRLITGVFLGIFLVSLIFSLGGVDAVVFAGGDGSVNRPYQIENLDQLESMTDYPNAHFKLIKDINCEAYDYSYGNTNPVEFQILFKCENFNSHNCDAVPTYDLKDVFTGSFDGQKHKICGLNIESSDQYTSLFGCVERGAVIKNLFLVGIQVKGQNEIGALAGYNKGTIENVHLLNYMFGSDNKGIIGGTSGKNVGGLVGINEGTLYRCSSNGGLVSGGERVGGLVGWNRNFFSAEKTGLMNCLQSYINEGMRITLTQGGIPQLVYYYGENYADMKGGFGHVIESYSYSRVEGDNIIGGLVGQNDFHIVNGFVNGGFNVATRPNIFARSGFSGGITGINTEIATIESSYASNNLIILGSEAAGGIAGINDKGVIKNCFGGMYDTTIQQGTGGLVGGWGDCNFGQIINSAGGGSTKKDCINFRSRYDSNEGFIPAGIIYEQSGYTYTTETIKDRLSTGNLRDIIDFAVTGEQFGYTYNTVETTVEQISCNALNSIQCNSNPTNSWNRQIWDFTSTAYTQPVFNWNPLTYCGDGEKNSPNSQGINEQCDDGANNGKIGYCKSDCSGRPVCGNGILEAGEECDDGNTYDGDTCKDCKISNPVDLKYKIKDLYWSNYFGTTKINLIKQATGVKGVIELKEQLTGEYEIRYQIRKDQAGFDKVVKDRTITTSNTNTKYYITWIAGLDSSTNSYSTGTYHFRISFDGGKVWYSTKNGQDFYTNFGELGVTLSSTPDNKITGCTESDECWLKDNFCTNDCECQTGYVQSAGNPGACVPHAEANCGSVHKTTISSLPSSNLCITGVTATEIETTETGWDWKCGTSICFATKTTATCSEAGGTCKSSCSTGEQNLGQIDCGTGNVCCKGDSGGNGGTITDITCNEDVNGKTFEDLSDVPLEKCSNGSSPPFLYNPNQDSLEKTWRCGEETCKLFLERKPEETQSDQFYVESDKGCDLGKEFETIIYKDKATNQQVGNAQKIYCPAALPFFTIRNVVAVVILIGLVYIIFALRNQNKNKTKVRKSSKKDG